MNKKCQYGCGRKAHYKMSSGKYCCSESYNSCPGKRKKDSASKKGKTYKELYGRQKPGGFTKGNTPWNTGKETDEETRKKISRFMTDNPPSGIGSTEEKEKARREKLRQQINKRYANGWMPKAGRCKKIDYDSPLAGLVKVDGTWELSVAKFLDSQNVPWKRNKTRFGYFYEKDRFYTPDFYLVEDDIYIEVKGYMTDKDRAKWNQFPYKLVILMKNEIRMIKKGTYSMKQLMETIWLDEEHDC